MGTCLYCGKHGPSIRVGVDGLCSRCVGPVTTMVEDARRLIWQSDRILNKSRNHTTRLYRCELVLKRLPQLEHLEKAGIPTTDPPPSELREIFRGEREVIVCVQVLEKVERLLSRSEQAGTRKGKRRPIEQGLELVAGVKATLRQPEKLGGVEMRLRDRLAKLETPACGLDHSAGTVGSGGW